MEFGEQLNNVSIHPLTGERWRDFEALFGARGACAGCWCMWWRLTRAEFQRQQGEGNRQAIKAIVASNREPGLLAYVGDVPAGWCAVAPRDEFSALNRSRILKPIDDQLVWSVVCFFVARRFRKQGLTLRLLEDAVKYARQHGGRIVEGYPIEPRQDQAPDPFVFTGLASTFRKVGFVECARRSETRPIMRYYLSQESSTWPDSTPS